MFITLEQIYTESWFDVLINVILYYRPCIIIYAWGCTPPIEVYRDVGPGSVSLNLSILSKALYFTKFTLTQGVFLTHFALGTIVCAVCVNKVRVFWCFTIARIKSL